MKDGLEGLWNSAVKPVLNEFGFTRNIAPGEVWPRVWWVGSGLLNIFPIHAAGYHDIGPPETAVDRVPMHLQSKPWRTRKKLQEGLIK
jgi:hypothetical protein